MTPSRMASSERGGTSLPSVTAIASMPGCVGSSSTPASTSSDAGAAGPIEIDLSPIDATPGVDMAVAIADRELLDGALRRLDPEWRAIVVMHYFLGMPLPEVARGLGIPLGTAKSRLHRSLGLMRIDLAGEEPGPIPVPEGGPA